MPEAGPIIFQRRGTPESWTLRVYRESGGYEGLRKAVTQMAPDDVVKAVSDAGLRGRGGAGFPTGRKWSFTPKDSPKPTYVVCNADEGEPGTFHDREIVEIDPHLLLEGIATTCYAVGATKGFVYLRGEMLHAYHRLTAALAEAREAGLVGERIFGSDFSVDIVIHRGAGGYICGEETALLESLEGYRGMPRSRPPFPAIAGLYASPTVLNNVQTLCNVGPIVLNGPEWFRQWGTEQSPGTMTFSVSGAVRRPGNVELPLGTPVRELIDACGGLTSRGIKAFVPGGSSTPMLTPDHLETPMSFEGIAEAGSLLGTGALVVIPEDFCIVQAVLRWMEFYEHESCGKCTPCREGTYWLARTLRRIEDGEGRERDLEVMPSANRNMVGKTLCALADGAGAPVSSSLKFFRQEYEEHIRGGGCPFRGATAKATV